jgi:hypothetical protein
VLVGHSAARYVDVSKLSNNSDEFKSPSSKTELLTVYHWDGSSVVVGSGHLADAVEPIKKMEKKKALMKIMDYLTAAAEGDTIKIAKCLKGGSLAVDSCNPRTFEVTTFLTIRPPCMLH